MVMFFNVKMVRDFLIEHGEVYTLRKLRKRLGSDVAVFGALYKHTTFAKINITFIGKITSANQLENYVYKSGLNSAKEWFSKATEMSGYPLYLYHVEVKVEQDSKGR